jgi:cyclophilin family peptidyl-prolyl cis-trans isomerase
MPTKQKTYDNMLTRLVFGLALLTSLAACQPKDKVTYALISTDFGDMKVKLYNSTPLHRDNFIKLANEGFFDGLLFHRVIAGFMIQGGDPDSRDAPPGKDLGMGGPGYLIPAEINALHFKGALAAARTQNPEKQSSGSQFYVVQGKPVSAQELDAVAQRSGHPYSDVQKQLYAEIGGTPMLDYEYTVFGEVVEGLEVIDAIAAVPKQAADRPVSDVRMTVKILN